MGAPARIGSRARRAGGSMHGVAPCMADRWNMLLRATGASRRVIRPGCDGLGCVIPPATSDTSAALCKRTMGIAMNHHGFAGNKCRQRIPALIGHLPSGILIVGVCLAAVPIGRIGSVSRSSAARAAPCWSRARPYDIACFRLWWTRRDRIVGSRTCSGGAWSACAADGRVMDRYAPGVHVVSRETWIGFRNKPAAQFASNARRRA